MYDINWCFHCEGHMVLLILPLPLLWCSLSLRCRDCAVHFNLMDSINLTKTFCQFLTLLTGSCWRFFACCTLYQKRSFFMWWTPTEIQDLTKTFNTLTQFGWFWPSAYQFAWCRSLALTSHNSDLHYLLLTPQSSLGTGGISYALVAPWESHLFHAYGS